MTRRDVERIILRALRDYAGTENVAKFNEWMAEARDVAERIERDGLDAVVHGSEASA